MGATPAGKTTPGSGRSTSHSVFCEAWGPVKNVDTISNNFDVPTKPGPEMVM